MPNEALDPTVAPDVDTNEPLEDWAALCLSGGGYRAMLFHVGTLLALERVGVSAVSSRRSCLAGSRPRGQVVNAYLTKPIEKRILE